MKKKTAGNNYHTTLANKLHLTAEKVAMLINKLKDPQESMIESKELHRRAWLVACHILLTWLL